MCGDGSPEVGFQKVAIYVDSKGIPTHAARQLLNGQWTSELGQDIDVRHDAPEELLQVQALQGYGGVAIFLKRARSV